MRTVGIIGCVGLPANYGGFETLVDHLVQKLSDDFEITVYCSKTAYKKEERKRFYNGAKLVYVPFKANGVTSVLYDTLSYFKAAIRNDIVLVLGVSSGLFFPLFRLFFTSKIIVNIDGLEWKRQKWSSIAKRFLKLSETFAVNFANAVVADNFEIKKYVYENYGKDSWLIAYGGDHVRFTEEFSTIHSKYGLLPGSYYLALARIEPENNIHLILEAFLGVGHELVFIGNWDRSSYGKELWKKYNKEPNITLLNSIYNQCELDQFRSNCIAYIHGHSAGGTNPSLVEIMHYGKTVFSWDCLFNRDSTEDSAIFFSSAYDLQHLLLNFKGDKLASVGKELRDIASKKYSWSRIVHQYYKLFNQI